MKSMTDEADSGRCLRMRHSAGGWEEAIRVYTGHARKQAWDEFRKPDLLALQECSGELESSPSLRGEGFGVLWWEVGGRELVGTLVKLLTFPHHQECVLAKQ